MNTLHKCIHPDCNNQISRTPYEVEIGKHLYCSRKCMWNRPKVDSKYDAHVPYIIANFTKLSYKEMAAHIGLSTVDAFRKAILDMRKRGHDIPIRTFKVRKKKEKPVRIPKVKAAKTVKVKIVKEHKVVSKSQCHGKPIKREVIQMPNRVIDPSTLKSVRVNSKTVIQVKKEMPDNEAIELWHKRRNDSLKYHTYKYAV